MKSAFVSIIGRPSSGKSTFLNYVCGNKVAIVSSTPQTTRNKIRGIFHCPDGELVFVDTPGFHLSKKKLNLHLKKLILSSLKEVDLVLYMVDVSRQFGQEEKVLLSLISRQKLKYVVVLNKIDYSAHYRMEILHEINTRLDNPTLFEISSFKGTGIDSLLNALIELAPSGEELYPYEYYTDQLPEFRISETIREKAINKTSQEVPYALYVDIADMEMKSEHCLWVRAFIFVERESQKGIVIGKRGAKIQKIVKEAEIELNSLFPYKVKLDVRVKVKPKWRHKEQLLNSLIK